MSLIRRVLLSACFGLAAAVAPLAASAGEYGSDYVAQGKCGPFPRAVVATPAWACLGIVAGPADGLIMPRNVLEISPGRLLLIDMGGWDNGAGRLIEVSLDASGGHKLKTLLTGLDRPHGLALGPDGKIYIGEASAIWRFDPKDPKIVREKLVDGLPDTGRHPLKHFVFDPTTGDLIVNEGSGTDRCEDETANLATVQYPCPEVAGEAPRAALWRLHFDTAGKVASFKPIARGLRNSMAIAVEPKSGLIVQGENNIDFSGNNSPPEELNVIHQGGNYGWPYCTAEGVVPAFRRFNINCSKFDAPEVLMPAHGAPLGMLYYSGAMFPELSGKLIVSLHGYRDNGHRILAYDRAPDGRPVAPAPDGKLPGFPFQVVTGWDKRDGVRPMGAPVNIAGGSQGQIWFAEDKNRTVMVLMRGQAAAKAASNFESTIKIGPPPRGWFRLAGLLTPTCSQCHEDFRARTAHGVWVNLVRRGWINQSDLESSRVVHALKGQAPFKPMPPPAGISQVAGGQAALAAFLAVQ